MNCSIESLETVCASILKDHKDHPLKRIFGLDVLPTSLPVVNSSFTGAGKTVGLCAWLSTNYKTLPRKMVLAFKELELAAEFIVMFNSMVKERSETERKHLSRHISYVFGVSQEQIDKIEAKLGADKGNKTLKKVLHFLGNTDATTSLCKEKMIELSKAKVIITTHASAHNLACAGIIKGTDVIYDEAPIGCYQIHELTVGETKEAHIAKFLACTSTIDLALSGPKRTGKLLSCGVWTTSEVYTLSSTEVKELADSKGGRDHLRDSIVSSYGGFDSVDIEQDVQESDKKQVGLLALKEGVSPSTSSESYTAKPGDFTHFFVSYCDFNAWGANSISIMTACPEATSVAVLEKLMGTKFQTVESETSKARRALVASKATLVSMFAQFGVSVSCSKSHSASKGAVYAIQQMADLLGKFVNVFVVCHGWRAAEFQKLGIKTCKSNQTGLNTLKDCTGVGIANLDFQQPKDKIIERHIFGSEYDRRAQFVMAGGLGQSVMRSGLRCEVVLETTIIYFDERVEALWKLFVGC